LLEHDGSIWGLVVDPNVPPKDVSAELTTRGD
jgi:hypothetical protein